MKELKSAGTRMVFALFFSIFCVALIHGQESADRKIERIRQTYSEISAKIAKVEKGSPEDRLAGIAVNELVVNAAGKSWPAVGNFKEVYRFYYDEDGENPYPSKLLKITVVTESAARKYSVEFVYGPAGALIFYFERSADDDGPLERRVYFDKGVAFRIIDDGKARDKFSEEDDIVVNDILATENKLRGIFEATLE